MERFKLMGAVHLFLFRGGHVLLLRRFNTGYEDGNYSVPAGHLDGGETVTQAGIREAREECGIDIAIQDLSVVGVMHRRSRGDERVDFFLTTTHWTGTIVNREPDKCDDLSWYALENLPGNTIPYIREALTQHSNGLWFREFGWDN